MQIDELYPGGPRFYQKAPVFKLGTDSVLLAHFTNTARAKRAVDLGTGAGVLSVLLSGREPGLQIDAIDILPEAVSLTAQNAELNAFKDRIFPHLIDIRQIQGSLPAGAYDLAISNPPYFPAGSGKQAPQEARAHARDESLCTLDHLCAAAAYLLRWGGRFTLVHRPERLSEICCAMTHHGIEPKRLRAVALTEKHPPSLILIEGRRGGNPGLELEATLPLRDEAGGDSPEIRTIYCNK